MKLAAVVAFLFARAGTAGLEGGCAKAMHAARSLCLRALGADNSINAWHENGYATRFAKLLNCEVQEAKPL